MDETRRYWRSAEGGYGVEVSYHDHDDAGAEITHVAGAMPAGAEPVTEASYRAEMAARVAERSTSVLDRKLAEGLASDQSAWDARCDALIAAGVVADAAVAALLVGRRPVATTATRSDEWTPLLGR